MTLETLGTDLKTLYAKLSADFQKAKQAWTLISSPQTRNVLIAVGTDAIRLVKDAVPAAQATGYSLSLDAAVVADIKQLIADAKSADGVILTDLTALGIKL